MSVDGSFGAPRTGIVFFERRELERILRLYARKVTAGEWRDYAIDGLRDRAVFSVFSRASEPPLYQIEKKPSFERRQGAWAVIGRGGVIVRREHELEAALRFFEKDRFSVVK